MKIKLLVLTLLTIVFFASVAVLTFTARGIHNAQLPHVTAKRLTRESFSVSREGGGTMTYRQLAIPKAMLDEAGGLLIVVSRMVNGEQRDFAQAVMLKTGLEVEGFYEVTGGMMGHELVIFSSDRGVRSGDEVIVVK